MMQFCSVVLVLLVATSRSSVDGLLSAAIFPEEDALPLQHYWGTSKGNSKESIRYDDEDKNKSPETDGNVKNLHDIESVGGATERAAFEELYNDRPNLPQPNFRSQMFGIPPDKKFEQSPYPYGRRQSPDKLMYTKEIVIKQGRLKGIVRNMHPQTGLRDVDQFLGLPYAEAPVGSRRFMPPGAALPWNGVKIARHLPPVCPQNLPDMTSANSKMTKGRLEQLNRLLPYLKNENEDCLYLNVYVPREDGLEPNKNYPVLVYVHGESFEWNSGNPYDGSVLASYGQVIVVTLNYRLGMLGFMKPGISEHTVSNFGLLDQIAALHWIKENIVFFGGDKDSVTLMGHGTGAACVNFLMVSPVADGLFHRAILMSGSAMADWATTNYSLPLTMQIAEGVNCPLNDDNEEMLTCLRKKRYQDMQRVQTSVPDFSTRLGPIVDGHVIPNQPYKVMSQFTELFKRYDLLFGITEVESYHILNPLQLEEGLRKNERDDLLHLYMQSRFEIRPDLAFAMTMKRYSDIYNHPIKQMDTEHRDAVLDILSDARVVGPLMQTGMFHADVNPSTYMYVFAHNSAAGPYAQLQQSIPGEELAFIFGAPLAPAGPFHQKYNVQEKLLSEAVMAYWTNFAKTGNPKAPWKGNFVNLHPMEWERYDVDWPEFNKRNQCFINIGIPPSIGYKYRNIYTNYWNKELPDELNHIGTLAPFADIHATNMPRSGTSIFPAEIITGRLNNYPSRKTDKTTENPLRTLKLLMKETADESHEKAENMYNAPPTFGIVKSEPDEDHTTEPTTSVEENRIAKSEGTIHLLIGLIVVFLVFNVIIYSAFLFSKKGESLTLTRKLGITSCGGTSDEEVKRTKHSDGDDSYVLDIVRKSNTYEAVQSNHSPINGFKISRQLSSSTVDTHAKVCDWISRDIIKSNSPSFSLRGKSFLKRPKKINVAIDATPQARSDSVLRQEPIELTKQKSFEAPKKIIVCEEVDFDEHNVYESQTIKIDHKHSRSDPADMYYTIHQANNDEQVTSFMGGDINQTSRDESAEKDPLTVEEQLQTIKRRNFPKVLPNYPRGGNASDRLTSSFKRNSLPPNSFSITPMGKVAPLPPPRTISTLGRKPSSRRSSNAITTSPLMLAQDYPEEDEPEITHNTLIVGPIVPKSHESNYSTVKRQTSFQGPPKSESAKVIVENEMSKSFDTIAIPDEPIKQVKPSGIRPPTASPFSTFHYEQPSASAKRADPKILIKPSASTGIGFHADANTFGHSRIPQLRSSFASSSSSSSNYSSFSFSDRDKSTPESTSSDTTNSSTGTVKTELKQK